MPTKQTDVKNPRVIGRPITRLYGEKLRAGREMAGLTQKQAAEAIDVDQKVISRWERGEKQPTIQYLMALAKAYGCKVSAIMPRNQYPNAPLDPAERREHFWYRNAKIQGVADVEEYVDEMRLKYQERLGMKSASPRPDA